MNARLGRLAALTRGAAVVGLGVGTLGTLGTACTKSDPAAPVSSPPPPTVNALRMPPPNAMHPLKLIDAGDGPGDS